MSKYRKVLEESVIVTSNNRAFPTIQQSVATYEQTKKRMSYFLQKEYQKNLKYTQNPYTCEFW